MWFFLFVFFCRCSVSWVWLATLYSEQELTYLNKAALKVFIFRFSSVYSVNPLWEKQSYLASSSRSINSDNSFFNCTSSFCTLFWCCKTWDWTCQDSVNRRSLSQHLTNTTTQTMSISIHTSKRREQKTQPAQGTQRMKQLLLQVGERFRNHSKSAALEPTFVKVVWLQG